MLRSKRHTAIFVNFGTFFARIFLPLKRSGQVPEAITGENLMFEQPPIIPATSLRRPSDPRNLPSKIFGFFFLLFRPYRPYTRTYFFCPGTRNVRKCMPNIILFLVWGLILRYNDQKTCPKASNPPKNDHKISAFLALFGLIFGAIFTTFSAAAPMCHCYRFGCAFFRSCALAKLFGSVRRIARMSVTVTT